MLAMHHLHTRLFKFSAVLLSMTSTCAFLSTNAYAGFEESCDSQFQLNNNQYQACGNLPVLIPSNDNHINMYLLLSDLGLANVAPIENKPDSIWRAYDGIVPFINDAMGHYVSNRIPNARRHITTNPLQYYDERCSSLESGYTDFKKQLDQLAIPTSDKNKLNAERLKIKECNQKLSFIEHDPKWSPLTKQYASYINGNIAFYNNQHETALKIYQALSQVQDSWLKETAQYMKIRAQLNLVYQSALGDYGDLNLSKVNQNQLKLYFNFLEDYFKLYANGRYAASARGLLRRGYWLMGRQDLLIQEYIWQLNHPKSKFYNLEMRSFIEELDRRIFRNETLKTENLKHPFLLATYDLMYMRQSSTDGYKPITWSALNAQKAMFKEQPDLFQYLQAVHLFHIQKKPQQALEQLPKNIAKNSPKLALSVAFLKGEILELTQQQNAEQYWNTLHQHAKDVYSRNMYEALIATHAAQKQDYASFIGSPAKISQAYLQRRFITEYANEKSLQSIFQASQSTHDQKQVALFSLLTKSIKHQNYALFNQYINQLPQAAHDYVGMMKDNQFKYQPPFSDLIWQGTQISPQLKCPDLKSLSIQLASKPKDELYNICLGEYMRSEKAMGLYEIQSNNTFAGAAFARGNVYKEVINKGAKGDLHAYALYRAIQCYAPSGINDCNDEPVEKSVRKQWFDRIKKEYPNTTWAKSLKYYW